MSYLFGGGKSATANTVGGEDASALAEVKPQDIVKEGLIYKQSRYWKEWRE